jgi:hypothetical protein
MKKLLFLLTILSFSLANVAISQDTRFGIGFYPTGTEVGIGYRSAKQTRFAFDLRATKANFYSNPQNGTMINEASAVYRIFFYEKVRMHMGLGFRADWNFSKAHDHRLGIVMPIGVEAFPFPFQNAGLIFEVAPYCTSDRSGDNLNLGMRTIAGFVFYIVKKEKNETSKE